MNKVFLFGFLKKYVIPAAHEALIRVFSTARPQKDTLALIEPTIGSANTLEGKLQDEIWQVLIVVRTVTHWCKTTKSALVEVGNPSGRTITLKPKTVPRHHISGNCDFTSDSKCYHAQQFGKLPSSNRFDYSPRLIV